METAPLTLAYTHARNAAQETRRSNPVAASEEHDLAAAEFVAAAAGTTDKEALRVLKLLEQHHKQLALILKEPQRKLIHKTEVAGTAAATTENNQSPGIALPPRLAPAARRDLSGSYASDIRSKRGIPGAKQKRVTPASPLISNEHADGTFAQDSSQQSQAQHTVPLPPQPGRPSWAPPRTVTGKSEASSPSSNSPFQQFYSRFENAISSLTAPLAFASLPLSQPTQSREEVRSPTSQQPSRRFPPKAAASSSVLDYSQLISNAALKAVRDANESAHSRPHESFLLVPTSGGTMSYADIAAATHMDRQLNRHKRNQSNASNDDFVDATSQLLQQSPDTGKDKWADDMRYAGKTMEELQLENQVLRMTQNDITKRLHRFELAAQEARLAQSIRSLHLSPVTTPENSRGKMVAISGGHADAGLRLAQRRIEELEDALRKNDRRLSKREDENAKLKETLGKYREKWEGLKAGAKARREQAAGGDKLRVGNSASNAAAVATSPVKDNQTGSEVKTDTDISGR